MLARACARSKPSRTWHTCCHADVRVRLDVCTVRSEPLSTSVSVSQCWQIALVLNIYLGTGGSRTETRRAVNGVAKARVSQRDCAVSLLAVTYRSVQPRVFDLAGRVWVLRGLGRASSKHTGIRPESFGVVVCLSVCGLAFDLLDFGGTPSFTNCRPLRKLVHSKTVPQPSGLEESRACCVCSSS